MKFISHAFLLILLLSCAQVRIPFFTQKEDPTQIRGWTDYGQEDYSRHLASFESTFLNSEKAQELVLIGKAREYIENLAYLILQNNELFFQDKQRPRIHIIKDSIPYHFSIPGKVVFLSTALVNKYIKHEAILAAVLCYELIRSEKNLYNRSIIIPVGYLPVERMLAFNRIEVDEKMEIHKWAYYSIRRSGFDGEYYLSWLQTINRNTADFIPLQGDAGSISREEALFKAFMIRRAKSEDELTYARRESSKEFYQFLFYVKDRSV